MQRLTFDDLPLQFDHLMVVHVGNAVYIYLCALLARSTQVIPAVQDEEEFARDYQKLQILCMM